jgi:hypothetical protein
MLAIENRPDSGDWSLERPGAPSFSRRAAQLGKPVAKALLGAAGDGLWSLIENTPRALGMGMTVGGHAFRAVNSGLDAVEDVYGMLTHREADPMAIVEKQQARAQMRPDYAHDLPDLEEVPQASRQSHRDAQFVEVDISPPKRKKKGKAAQVELVIEAAKAKAAEHYRMDADDSDWSGQAAAPAANSIYDMINHFRKGSAYDQEEEVRRWHRGTAWGY